MTKTSSYVLIIVLLSLLPFLITLLNPNLIHTSDGGVQLPRMAAYYKALVDFHFPVRWAGDLNYGYGLPLFNFIYQLPYWISSFFLLLGTGLVRSFKLTLLTSYIISGLGMFWFAYELLRDKNKALLIAIFYQFSPFRFVELLIRGAIGGIYTYAFLPFVLVGLTKLIKQQSIPSFILTVFATALLILSHNSLSMVFVGISVLYLLLFSQNKQSFFWGLTAIGTGLALASFYWIPAIAEHKYTYGDLFMKNLYKTHFPPIQNFFIPNVFYYKNLLTAEISVQFGLFHTLAIAAAIYLLIKKRSSLSLLTRKILYFNLFFIALSLFLMQPISIPLWERFSLLRQFQFPWRFLAVTSFATSFLALSYFSVPLVKKSWGIILILVFTIASTAYYWYPREGFDKVDEQDFWNYPLNTTYFGETDVVWSAGPAGAYPKERLEVIEGSGVITNFVNKTQKHTALVDVTSDSRLVDYTQYFPGWRVFIDNKKTNIEFQDVNWRGLITFKIPQGKHDVRIEFGESPVRLFADIISLATFISLLALSLFVLRSRISLRETVRKKQS